MNKIYNAESLIPIAVTLLLGVLSLFLGFFVAYGTDGLSGTVFVTLFFSLLGVLPAVIFSPVAYYFSKKIKAMPLFLDYISIWGIWLLTTMLIAHFSGLLFFLVLSGGANDWNVWDLWDLMTTLMTTLGTSIKFMSISTALVFPLVLLLPVAMTIIIKKGSVIAIAVGKILTKADTQAM